MHNSWTSKDGVPAMVQALAQTPDGYLWLGTYEGLFRFDGVSFEHIAPAEGHPTGSIPVSALLVTRRGELWVGYAGGAGVEVLRGGRLIRGGMPGSPGEVTGLAEDIDGAIWVVGGRGRKALKRYAHGAWQALSEDWGVPDDQAVSTVLPARDGTVWIAMQKEVLFLRRGASRFEPTGLRISNGAGMAQDAEGSIWLSDAAGTRILPDYPGGARPPSLRAPLPNGRTVRRISLIADRRGTLWGSTYTDGVFRIPKAEDGEASPDPVYYRTSEGLTSNEAVAVFEDREGNIWVATELGLDQFRRANIESIRFLSGGSASGYLSASDDRGDVYIATGTKLYRSIPNGEPLLTADLGSDIDAMCKGRGSVWVAQRGRITRIEDGRVSATLSLPDQKPVSGCGEDRIGQLWLARPAGDLLFRTGSSWSKIPLPRKRTPLDIFIDWRGRIAGTLNRRSVVIYDGRSMKEISADALGVAGLTAIYGNATALLIAGGNGLARWDGRHIQRLTINGHPWLRGLRAIVQTPAGETWAMNNKGIIRLSTTDLDRAFDHPGAAIPHEFFDEQDGFNSRTQNSEARQLAMGGDDRLWFLTRQGVLRVDPTRLKRNAVRPPVDIRAVIADGRRYRDPTELDLPAGTRNLSIQYTALSLTIPNRVRFRYRLRGFDSDWIDPGERRQAFYTNLAPGTYMFDVVAANNDGVWNNHGVSLKITIPPTFMQSRLFYGLCLVVAAALLWSLYRLRLHTIAARMRVRLSERLAERERIARELHDTLLQSVQALMLKFQLAADDIPEDRPVRRSLEQALDRADKVLAEGRSRVSDLRITESADNLDAMIRDIVKRQVFSPDVIVNISVSGEPRALNLLACDELARIANEAIFNIWLHAHAARIDIGITYGVSKLTVIFKDDGVGMPADVVSAGRRAGHFGLPGMRERADRLAADLKLRSAPSSGTELKVSVPARIAYISPSLGWRLRTALLGRKLR